MKNDKGYIVVNEAKVNNLKNVSVKLPRSKFIVFTGLSGSGKTSLAFDTIYAEGQRRYVESLSSYARQFMGKMAKPDCRSITGLPPAIAIRQHVNTRNPRSTVGTSTEIYDYLRLLFARIGHTFSPVSGCEVRCHSIDDVVAEALRWPDGTRIAIASPINLPERRTFATQLDVYLKGGFSRLLTVDFDFVEIRDVGANVSPDRYSLLIDRLAVAHEGDELSRLRESVEAAFYEGNGQCRLVVWTPDGIVVSDFSNRFEADGIRFIEPNDLLFNFNNPYGACPSCEGFGRVIGIDEDLVVPNTSLSVYQDAVACWRGDKMSQWKDELVRVARLADFPIHRPYCDLTQEQKDFLWHGNELFPGIDGFFRMVEENQYKIQYRVMMARFRGKTLCPTCHGSRLRKEALYVKIADKTIADLTTMSIDRLLDFFRNLALDEVERKIASRLLTEITSRLEYLCNVGLNYLTLDRLSSSLSGGESQRINLATSLGSGLVGSLYILDEPSVGLHPRDNARLISVLRNLQQMGNTVVVVEHDEEIMRSCDYIVDVGPEAGSRGGEIVYQGSVEGIEGVERSYTMKYLTRQMSIPVPKSRRKWRNFIEVKGARHHNLKNLDVKFPLGVLTVVSGVSGSGKSTLVRDILYNGLVRLFGDSGDAPGAHTSISGDIKSLRGVQFVDQNPIGKSSRSNPATYVKAYDEIRQLFADQQASKQMGFTPAYFSFNTDGGRCDECKGEGTITIEMQFMADITIPCESCHGRRFKKDILEITYRGKNISDVLNMTVDEAIDFFGVVDAPAERRILRRLRPLKDVGLGYIKLGQTSATLSGGENQRVKLAYYLAQEHYNEPMLFIFDEPTTGLHFHDILTLLASFNRLIQSGHSVIIIEHNLDVIKCADYVIDLGPEGGDAGGSLVVAGTPEEVVACEESLTGKFLKEKL